MKDSFSQPAENKAKTKHQGPPTCCLDNSSIGNFNISLQKSRTNNTTMQENKSGPMSCFVRQMCII